MHERLEHVALVGIDMCALDSAIASLLPRAHTPLSAWRDFHGRFLKPDLHRWRDFERHFLAIGSEVFQPWRVLTFVRRPRPLSLRAKIEVYTCVLEQRQEFGHKSDARYSSEMHDAPTVMFFMF